MQRLLPKIGGSSQASTAEKSSSQFTSHLDRKGVVPNHPRFPEVQIGSPVVRSFDPRLL